MTNRAEIITIGDEILIGQTVDSNSAFIGSLLSSLGFEIRQITTVSDDPGEIERSLEEGIQRADLVIITGGLGPTRDDITKQTLCRFFGGKLKEDPVVLEDIRNLLVNRKVPMNEMNIAQALVPDNCLVMRNFLGTAPGMVFEREGRVIISLPGVPYEMKALMLEQVVPLINGKYSNPVIIHRMVMTSGYPESYLASLISEWETNLPASLKLAYLPSPGIVKLRLTARGTSREELEATLDTEIKKLMGIIPQVIFSLDNISLEEALGNILREKGMTIATAESCTGGSIARLITSVPGASDYFTGSVIAYNNVIKTGELGVPPQVIMEKGAVSREVVEIMAANIRIRFKTDIAVAVSGIAGPGGGTEDKPVGTVYIAVAGPSGIESKQYFFGNQRDLNITRASMAALTMLTRYLK